MERPNATASRAKDAALIFPSCELFMIHAGARPGDRTKAVIERIETRHRCESRARFHLRPTPTSAPEAAAGLQVRCCAHREYCSDRRALCSGRRRHARNAILRRKRRRCSDARCSCATTALHSPPRIRHRPLSMMVSARASAAGTLAAASDGNASAARPVLLGLRLCVQQHATHLAAILAET